MKQNFLRWSSTLAATMAASLALLTGCHNNNAPANNSGLIPVRLQADWYPQPEQGGYFTAVAKGYYQAEGLDVTILPLGQYTSGLQVVSSGGAEFGLGASDQILEAVSNGLPLMAIGATMQHDPQAVMVHKNSLVRDFAGLEGHTVAAQPGATWFKFIVSKYHLKDVRETPATHSIANFLQDPNYIQQIFVTSEPYFVGKAGGDFRTMLISGAGYDPYRVFFTRNDYLAQHPDVVAKFVRASIKGWQEYMRDPAPANALILKMNPAQNPEQMQYTIQALKDGSFITGADPSGSEIGKMNAARWAATNTQLTQLGVIRKQIDPTTAYTLKYVQ
ncbi:ABC transporter substrate-binding protein [Acidicapsa ligni]|uniref:ABC transporter substrate-binding protein n=1 Tax=Acidicapsa ligni TaxID=542300 RepID=UPI0021E00DDF|nr:ABC transporter substrate-binding protein [Acidicapsa ligni]